MSGAKVAQESPTRATRGRIRQEKIMKLRWLALAMCVAVAALLVGTPPRRRTLKKILLLILLKQIAPPKKEGQSQAVES